MINSPKPGNPARRVTYLAIMAAAAFVLSAVESLIPIPAPTPGFKLGLANIVTLVLLINDKNPVYAVAVTVVRCILSALVLGVMSSLLFSLAGGLISCFIMWFLLHYNFPFSTIGTSVAGALSHNAAQLAAAALIARDTAIFSYFPALAAAGLAAGCATGYIALKIIGTIKKLLL